MPEPRTVVIAAFPGVELLEVTGPAEVFSIASRLVAGDAPAYRVEVAAPQAGPLPTAAGIDLVAARSLAEVGPGVDTLLVAGAMTTADGRHEAVVDPDVVAWLATAAPAARRVGGVCAGVHLLAAAGLLAGLPATTHWLTADRLAAEYPDVAVDPEPIFIRAGRTWTCAGVTSALDLALAMVAEDLGPALALDAARAMVMYVKRPGGQSQFSVPLSLQTTADDRIDGLRRWIDDNLAARISVETMAARLHLRRCWVIDQLHGVMRWR
ncbi:GlxA family transcriptional regulator [Kitasatospora sp. A2-31]|uniref:GlxA family transcriptional regulator n=1 Tax=Kitasatospora sp. A2-31 TaxID=2916414 RepID=UPI001EECD97D|nr:DJ-1/PfpI family protein [Kitasatospora sp. A2-31]MCG6497998.1 DJ-1/PfpI family protein [Kitasatospora sp. A2-31]